jgi:hypothetical protein
MDPSPFESTIEFETWHTDAKPRAMKTITTGKEGLTSNLCHECGDLFDHGTKRCDSREQTTGTVLLHLERGRVPAHWGLDTTIAWNTLSQLIYRRRNDRDHKLPGGDMWDTTPQRSDAHQQYLPTHSFTLHDSRVSACQQSVP